MATDPTTDPQNAAAQNAAAGAAAPQNATPGAAASHDAASQDAAAPVALDRAIEAILFIADEPVPVVALAAALSQPVAAVKDALARLAADYDGTDERPSSPGAPGASSAPSTRPRAFELREVGGGWRLYLRAEFDDIAADFVTTQRPTKLSQAALETLTVVAYRQPVARSQVAAVRAVNVDSVLRTLLARGLVTEVGEDATTGATLYGTTEVLLTHLGINSLDELPKISPLLDDGQDGYHE